MSALEQAIRKTTTEYVKSFMDASREKNPQLVLKCLAADCVRHFGPPAFLRGVGAPPDFSLSNAEYAAMFEDFSVYTISAFEIHNMTVDTANRKAAAWSILHTDFIDGTTLEHPHVWFLDFNEDGSKIVKIHQQNDVQENAAFRAKVKQLKETTASS